MESSRSPLITIAMPTSNSAWALPKVLESILKFDYDKSKLRLVFVDNYSTDNTVSVLQIFAESYGALFESIVIKEEHANIPVARNICFENSVGSDYVFILDSDVIAPPDTLKTLLRHFVTYENVGMASFPWDHTNAKSRARFLYNAFEVSNIPAIAYKVGNGCNLLSMRAYRQVGDFNPKLNVHEDGEYCYRLRQKGFNIICDFSHEGIHLKRVPTSPKFYLKFVWNSSNTYIEMLKLGSGMHILKFLTTLLMIFSLVIVFTLWQVIPLYLFIALLIFAFWVNTSKRILDDGIHVKISYLPIVAPVMTTLTALVVLASTGRITWRAFSSVIGRRFVFKVKDPKSELFVKATS